MRYPPTSTLFPYTTLFRSKLRTAIENLGRILAVELTCAAHGLDLRAPLRSEEHTSELQSPVHLVCRLLLEKKNNNIRTTTPSSTQPPTPRAPIPHTTRHPA